LLVVCRIKINNVISGALTCNLQLNQCADQLNYETKILYIHNKENINLFNCLNEETSLISFCFFNNCVVVFFPERMMGTNKEYYIFTTLEEGKEPVRPLLSAKMRESKLFLKLSYNFPS